MHRLRQPERDRHAHCLAGAGRSCVGSLSPRVPLEGSRSRVAAEVTAKSDPDPSARIEATILVRRRPESGTSARVDAILRGQAPVLSSEEAAASLGADPRMSSS
jgi:hypothetical protein